MTANLPRRDFLLATLGTAVSMGVSTTSHAEALPYIARILVGYPPGGTLDILCRKLAERLTGHWGRTVLVENKSGASGRMVMDTLKAAPADGTAMIVTPASVLTMYPHIYKNLSYDVFGDFSPVSIVAVFGFALAVGPAVPDSVQNLDALIAWCKTHPEAAQCGNPGAGSLPHFLAMLLARDAGIKLTHVPFRGGQPALQAVAGGQVSSALLTEGTPLAMAQAGRVRILATTGSERSSFLPNTPTFRELGFPNLAKHEWYGAFMAAKTPATEVARAAHDIHVALMEPSVAEVWHGAALSVQGSTPAELQLDLRTEYDYWGPIIHASGFTPGS